MNHNQAQNEPDQTKKSLHRKIADSYAAQRLPEAGWKALSALQPQLEEIHHRILAAQFEEAASVFKDIAFEYLLKWGENQIIIDVGERLQSKLTESNRFVLTILRTLGLAYMQVGKFDHAREKLERALQLQKASDKKNGLGEILGDLGVFILSLVNMKEPLNVMKKH